MEAKKVDVEIISEPVKADHRRIDFGNISVCSGCGSNLMQCSPSVVCGCGGVRTTLKYYVENVRKEKFDPSEWKFECEDVFIVSDEVRREMEDILSREIEKNGL